MLDYEEGPRSYEEVSEFLLGIEDNERKNESWQQMAVNLFNNEIPKGEYRIIYFSSEYIGKMLSLREEPAGSGRGRRKHHDTPRKRERKTKKKQRKSRGKV